MVTINMDSEDTVSISHIALGEEQKQAEVKTISTGILYKVR